MIKHVTPALSALALSSLFIAQPAVATSTKMQLNALLPSLLQVDARIIGADNDLLASREGIEEARAGYLPALTLTAFGGAQQRYQPTSTNDTFYGYNEQKLALSQLLYDWGKTSASLDTAHQTYLKSLATYQGTRQDVMLEGAKAYLNIYKAYQTLAYAARYETNVKQQVKMEAQRVSSGSGYSTDVLEAKAQLSGAEARVARAKGAMTTAENAFVRTFHEPATHASRFKIPKAPSAYMPSTLDSALKTATQDNTKLVELQYDVDIARQTIRTKKSAFGPSLDLALEGKRDWNTDGLAGQKQQFDEKVEFNYGLFNGFSDLSALRAAQFKLNSAVQSLDNQRRVTRQTVKDDWQSLITTHENYLKLDQQTQQLAKFLQLATKERQLGRKTLLEVLVADTNYINAADASIAAKVDLATARYTLIRDMNALRLNVFGASLEPRGRALITHLVGPAKHRQAAAMHPPVLATPRNPKPPRYKKPKANVAGYQKSKALPKPTATAAKAKRPTAAKKTPIKRHRFKKYLKHQAPRYHKYLKK